MIKIGLGTYSFGMDSTLPLVEKLQKAKDMGYTGIEFLANDMDSHSTQEIKEFLEQTGTECWSLHASMDLISGNIKKIADLGGKQIICPMHAFADAEEAIDCAKQLTEKAKEAAEYGLRIGYHNHSDEFFLDNGKPLLSYVIENTEPGQVYFQLDCGWATAAGVDCADYIKQYSGRFCSVHVKENNKFVEPQRPRSAKDPVQRPPIELDENGKPILTEAMKKMLEMLKERTKIQCPMGDASSRVDWKAIKAATDAQGLDCLWIVERENNYANDMIRCLTEDAAWLLNNL